MIFGYKCFDKGLINRYEFKYEVGKSYHNNNTLKFGNNGNGFHICLNLEDTLRYFDAWNKDVDICYVLGYGDYIKYDDEYYRYYDMFVFENIKILKLLSREDIINYALHLNEIRVQRFLSSIKLSENENKFFHITKVGSTITYEMTANGNLKYNPTRDNSSSNGVVTTTNEKITKTWEDNNSTSNVDITIGGYLSSSGSISQKANIEVIEFSVHKI